MARKFSTTVLDTLLKTVELELSVPLLGFGEIKLPVSQYAKEWWENEKSREELLRAIESAEITFIVHNPNNKAAQLLEEFSLKNEEGFQKVIIELVNNLDEQRITSKMAEKLGMGFENVIDNKEIQNALNDYIPFLRDELFKISGFREVMMYSLQKQLAKTISLNYEATKKILEHQSQKPEAVTTFTPNIISDTDKLPEPSDFLPPGSRMPFHRNKIFTGREQDLLTLAKFVLQKPSPSQNSIITQIAATSGMGGIGKTQLAVEFCYRYGSFFYGIHWINARDGNIAPEIAVCGHEMYIPNFPESLQDQVRTTLRHWKAHPFRLIILDNLEDPNLLSEWLYQFNGMCILITSRNSEWSNDLGISIYKIDALSRSQSLQLIRKISSSLDRVKDESLFQLAEQLGDLPLALDLAGRYLKAHPSLTPEEYLAKLVSQDNILNHSSLAGWVTENNPTKHETSLASTFLVSLSQLGQSQVDAIARKLFICTGYLAPNSSIPTDFFYTLSIFIQYNHYPNEQEKIQAANEITDEALKRLNSTGLISENNNIHPLISEFAKMQQDENESLIDYLSTTFQIVLQNIEYRGASYSILPFKLHIEIFVKHINLLSRAKQINFLRQYGKYLYQLGQYQKAVDVLQGIFEELENYKDKGIIVNTINILGLAYRETGEFLKALEQLSRAMAIVKENNLEEGQWATFNNLGMIYAALGKNNEAIKCYTYVLENRLKSYKDSHNQDIPEEFIQKQLLNTSSNLGLAYQAVSEFDKAIKTFEATIKMAKLLYGDEHPVIARDLGNIGLIYRDLGKPTLAQEYFERALKMYEKTLDPTHPDIAIAISNLGLSYQDLDKQELACQHFEKALQIKEKAFGRISHHVSVDLHNLGTVFISKGEVQKGIKLLEEATEIEIKIFGENHYEVAYNYQTLAATYSSLGEYDKARRLAKKSLAINKMVFKNEGLPIGKDYSVLGLISFCKKQYKRAFNELSIALTIHEKYLPKEHMLIEAIRELLLEVQSLVKK